MWAYIGICLGLTIVAGFMSGLTVGLASIDKLDLEIKKAIGTDSEKKSAKVIEKVVAKHHWMLCTLLLCNAACMEALPLFLDKLLPPTLAIIISVTAVLLFGEIIPQALATGPRQFRIAELSCPVVLFFMYITIFISWPLGKLLDCVLGGEHGNKRYKNHELRWLLKQHVAEALKRTAEELSREEVGSEGQNSGPVKFTNVPNSFACNVEDIDRVNKSLVAN